MMTDEQLFGILAFALAFTGTCANGIVAYFSRKLPTLQNAFGRLTASQATGNLLICSTFAFYFAPMMVFDIDVLKQYSYHPGFINLIGYDICIWSHLFISLNRLCAICFPFKYDQVFSRKIVFALIAYSWIAAVITPTVLGKFFPCDFYFSPVFWTYVFTESEICEFISWYVHFQKDITTVIIIAIVDVITVFYVHRTKELGFSSSSRRAKEINFLKQAVLQGIVFAVELFTYFYLSGKFTDHPYVVFCLTTLAWILVHTTDGIIIISFNREFRRLLASPIKHFSKSTRVAHGQTSHGQSAANSSQIHS